ncbi:MAG: hypothetical protein PVH88_25855 [Ignavibacteria bacterium]|jgi:hypothetical protein
MGTETTPKSGWSKAYTLDFIPNDKLVTFTALHQSGATQYLQIIDKNNEPISFTDLANNSTVQFPISGLDPSGHVGLLKDGVGSFTMKDGYKIQFGSSGSEPPDAIMSSPSTYYFNDKVYGGGAVFGSEDHGGTDYNDTSVTIQWYHSRN